MLHEQIQSPLSKQSRRRKAWRLQYIFHILHSVKLYVFLQESYFRRTFFLLSPCANTQSWCITISLPVNVVNNLFGNISVRFFRAEEYSFIAYSCNSVSTEAWMHPELGPIRAVQVNFGISNLSILQDRNKNNQHFSNCNVVVQDRFQLYVYVLKPPLPFSWPLQHNLVVSHIQQCWPLHFYFWIHKGNLKMMTENICWLSVS